MKSTDLRAKARAIFGSAIAEPMPNQPNGAKALQQRANARPIPTYKVGGVVKKNDGGLLKKPVRGSSVTIPLEEDRVKKLKKPANAPKMVDFEPRQPKTGKAPANAPKPPAMTRGPEADDVLITTRRGQQMLEAQKRREMEMEEARRKKQEAADRLLGIRMKKGGSVEKKADGGLLDRVGRAISDIANEGKTKKYGIPVGGVPRGSAGRPARNATDGAGSGSNAPVTVTRREESVTVNPNPPKEKTVRLNEKPKYVKLNEKPKYVKLNAHKDGGKVQTSSDTARKLATEMGGMKKGGKPKDGLAVMIAIGKPMKKPVKKAVGGAGKTRKGMMKG